MKGGVKYRNRNLQNLIIIHIVSGFTCNNNNNRDSNSSFLDPTCVPVRVSINKLNLVPNWIVAGLVGVSRNGGDLGTGES